jgi:hypothetical protein
VEQRRIRRICAILCRVLRWGAARPAYSTCKRDKPPSLFDDLWNDPVLASKTYDNKSVLQEGMTRNRKKLLYEVVAMKGNTGSRPGFMLLDD